MADEAPPELLEASCLSPLRKGCMLRSFGKDYLADGAYSHDLRLLCLPDGPEVHLFHFEVDKPATPAGCVLRPPQGLQPDPAHVALHAAWAPDAARPAGLLAVAWPATLAIYRVEVIDGPGAGGAEEQQQQQQQQPPLSRREVLASKIGEVKLDRKPSGLAWHPAAVVPLLAIFDITEVTLVQLPRDGGSSSSNGMPAPLLASTPSPARGKARARVHSGGAIQVASFSPSLPGALEAAAWSQWGKHLAVCMEGILRVYDWPANPNLPLDQLAPDPAALPHSDTRLRRRVRAIRAAGPRGFAATTESDISLLDMAGSLSRPGSATFGGGVAPLRLPLSPGRGGSSSSSSSLHLIRVPEAPGGEDQRVETRPIDIETAAVPHVAMPDLLAVKAVNGGPAPGEPATHALAAIGSHTSDTITVFRLSSHAGAGATSTVTALFTIHLPPSTRAKGVTFVGSRLVLLTGAREGAPLAVGAGNFTEFTLDLAVYNLPPHVFHSTHRPATPVRYTTQLLDVHRPPRPSSPRARQQLLAARYGQVSPGPGHTTHGAGGATGGYLTTPTRVGAGSGPFPRPASRMLYPPSAGSAHGAPSAASSRAPSRMDAAGAHSPAPSLGSMLDFRPSPFPMRRDLCSGLAPHQHPHQQQPHSQLATPVRAHSSILSPGLHQYQPPPPPGPPPPPPPPPAEDRPRAYTPSAASSPFPRSQMATPVIGGPVLATPSAAATAAAAVAAAAAAAGRVGGLGKGKGAPAVSAHTRRATSLSSGSIPTDLGPGALGPPSLGGTPRGSLTPTRRHHQPSSSLDSQASAWSQQQQSQQQSQQPTADQLMSAVAAMALAREQPPQPPPQPHAQAQEEKSVEEAGSHQQQQQQPFSSSLGKPLAPEADPWADVSVISDEQHEPEREGHGRTRSLGRTTPVAAPASPSRVAPPPPPPPPPAPASDPFAAAAAAAARSTPTMDGLFGATSTSRPGTSYGWPAKAPASARATPFGPAAASATASSWDWDGTTTAAADQTQTRTSGALGQQDELPADSLFGASGSDPFAMRPASTRPLGTLHAPPPPPPPPKSPFAMHQQRASPFGVPPSPPPPPAQQQPAYHQAYRQQPPPPPPPHGRTSPFNKAAGLSDTSTASLNLNPAAAAQQYNVWQP